MTALVAGDVATVASPSSFSVANAIPLSTVTAKGDLIAATGSGTVTNLAVGADGTTLVANSAATTGLQWASTPSASNPVLNSAMQVWQRGTSISLAASTPTTYLADRWASLTGANQAMTFSRQSTNDTTNLPNIQYCLRYQRNSGQTGTAGLNLFQSFESVNSIPFAGKTVTMSFYARAGANYSPTSSLLGVYLIGGTGTDQNWLSGYTGQTLPINSTATLTTTWQRFTYTGSVGATVTELSTVFAYNPVGTAGTNDYFEITGVQIDIGSVALPFRTYAGTFQGELAACQRYYQRLTAISGSSFSKYATGWGTGTTNAFIFVPLQVESRTPATSIDFSTLVLDDQTAGGAAVTAVVFANSGNTINGIAINCTAASGLVAYRPYVLMASASSTAYLGFSAEL